MQAHQQIGSSSAATTTATVGAVVMPCLYTKQKTKKRKTFTDGILKVSESNGLCILYSASDTFISAKEGSLESQFISPLEAKKVLQGAYLESSIITFMRNCMEEIFLMTLTFEKCANPNPLMYYRRHGMPIDSYGNLVNVNLLCCEEKEVVEQRDIDVMAMVFKRFECYN